MKSSKKEQERKSLLNGCSRTLISVTPKNWNTLKASMKKEWVVWFRFYDPNFHDKHPFGKLVSAAGMNVYKVLAERQEATRKVIQRQSALIDHHNFNPITGKVNIQTSVSEEAKLLN